MFWKSKIKNWKWSVGGSVWFSSIWFLFQIENWKSKIHNGDCQCLIPQELKIINLQSQSSIFAFKKHKIEKQFSMFWNQKLKIENGQLGPCGFRPFDFDSKLKIENQKFTIVIFNVCFLKNWKSQI